jgi:hypothetical protein
MNGPAFDRVIRAVVIPGSRRGVLLALASAPLGLLSRRETVAKKHGKHGKRTRKGECGRCKNGHCTTNDEYCRTSYGGDACIACDAKSLSCQWTSGNACGPCQVCQVGDCQGCTLEEQTACSDASFACTQVANQQHCDCYCACGDNVSCQHGCRSDYDARADICLHNTPGCFQPCGDGEVLCLPVPLQRPGICLCGR